MIPLKVSSEEISEEVKQKQTAEIEQAAEDAKIAAEEARINQISIQLTQKAESLKGTKQGQCVIAVRNFLGVGRDQIHGYVQTKINSQYPQVGNIIVIIGKYRHSGVVLFSTEDSVIYYDSNGSLNERAAIREIDIDSSAIKGYRDTGVLGI